MKKKQPYHSLPDDTKHDYALRPKTLSEYIGQETIKAQLKIFIEAAKNRNDTLDHVLLFGPPGLGKTTLANIIAKEMNANLKYTSGPTLDKAGDLAGILTSLEADDILFIDEIHRMSPIIEEVLYPAMEDFKIDIMLGDGSSARSVQIDIPKFTLIGATTRAGMLTNPLRDRFGIIARLNFYTADELALVIQRSAKLLHMVISHNGASELARRSRGTPRIANRLLRRIRDIIEIKQIDNADECVVNDALNFLEVDSYGLDITDQKLLLSIIDKFNGGPVGLETLASTIGESTDTVENLIEPFLMQIGLLQRTARGRCVTQIALDHFNIVY